MQHKSCPFQLCPPPLQRLSSAHLFCGGVLGVFLGLLPTASWNSARSASRRRNTPSSLVPAGADFRQRDVTSVSESLRGLEPRALAPPVCPEEGLTLPNREKRQTSPLAERRTDAARSLHQWKTEPSPRAGLHGPGVSLGPRLPGRQGPCPGPARKASRSNIGSGLLPTSYFRFPLQSRGILE